MQAGRGQGAQRHRQGRRARLGRGAVAESLTKLSHAEVRSPERHPPGVGAITETDVSLAAASDAIIIGFNVRPTPKAHAPRPRANGVDIRLYNIIYDAIDDVRSAMEGLLAPTLRGAASSGRPRSARSSSIPKIGTIAGCYVTDGKVSTRGAGPGCCATASWSGRARTGLAPALQGRRPRGRQRLRVRHRPRELQRHQGRRRDRVLQHGGNQARSSLIGVFRLCVWCSVEERGLGQSHASQHSNTKISKHPPRSAAGNGVKKSRSGSRIAY